MIEIRNVSKSYGGAPVLRDVSVSLPAGGLTAIVGPNGAGKSTLLSVASRLVPMDAGSVTVGGLDVARTASDRLARKLAILRQENRVLARLSVRDLVAFGRFPYSRGRTTAEDRERVEEALARLDLLPLADRFVDELSGGQRQRAFVAMALCQDTEYLLLDEPLNSLDVRHAVAMMRLFRQAADEMGKTVVVVLHDVNFASCWADRMLVMKDGRAVALGAPEEIVTAGAMREIYGVEAEVRRIDGRPVLLYFMR